MKSSVMKCLSALLLCVVLFFAVPGECAEELKGLSIGGKPFLTADTAMVLGYYSYFDNSFGEPELAYVGIQVQGDIYSYQWYEKTDPNGEFHLDPDNSWSIYQDYLDPDDYYREVYCVITDDYGNTLTTCRIFLIYRTKPTASLHEENIDDYYYYYINGEDDRYIFYNAGDPVTLTVNAKGVEPLKYEWFYQENGASTFVKSNSFKGRTYSLDMTKARGGRTVFCRVTDANGESCNTNMMTLLYSSLKITKQPVSISVAPGETAKVTVSAKSDHKLTYEWYYKNAGDDTFVKTTSFTGKTYSVKMNASRAGRQVYCIVRDATRNRIQTNTVTLGMETGLQITRQPQSVKVLKNSTAKVSLSAKGEGLKYTWYYKEAGSSNFRKTTAFTGNTYSVRMTSARAGRQVYCVVSDKYGNKLKTDIVTLDMGLPVQITSSPNNQTAWSIGETLSTSVQAVGDGLTYTWYYKDRNSSRFSKTSTFTGDTYTVPMTAARINRQVYCVVTDQYGKKATSDVATLTYRGIADFQYLYQSTYTAMGRDYFQVRAFFGGDDCTYTWYYRNPGMRSFVADQSNRWYTYTCPVSEGMGRTVYCVATDKYGFTARSSLYTLPAE